MLANNFVIIWAKRFPSQMKGKKEMKSWKPFVICPLNSDADFAKFDWI